MNIVETEEISRCNLYRLLVRIRAEFTQENGLNWSFNYCFFLKKKKKIIFGHLYSHKEFKELHTI